MTHVLRNYFWHLLLICLMLIMAIAPLVMVQAASAQDIENNLCAGANLNVDTNCNVGITDQDATARVNGLIADVINLFSLVVGVVSVIMIIIGGFRYIVSGGDSSNVTSAKNTILYAIIGLVIVALAQWIVRFVLGRVIEA